MHPQPTSFADRWPASRWNKLTGIDTRLLDQLAFLCRLTHKSSRTGAYWCHPSRRWLAQQLRCSIPTITRHVAKLKQLGALIVFQPRKQGIWWQTNIYRIISPSAWKVAALRHLLSRIGHRRSKVISLASKNSESPTQEQRRADFTALLKRWQARGAPA